MWAWMSLSEVLRSTVDLSRGEPCLNACWDKWCSVLFLPCFRYQTSSLFQRPSLVSELSAEITFLQRHYSKYRRLELCHLEGRRHGNNTHQCEVWSKHTLLTLDPPYSLYTPHHRTGPSSSHTALSRFVLLDAGPYPDLLSFTSGRTTAALMCGICWRRPVSRHRCTPTSPTPKLPASNPGAPPVSVWRQQRVQ